MQKEGKKGKGEKTSKELIELARKQEEIRNTKGERIREKKKRRQQKGERRTKKEERRNNKETRKKKIQAYQAWIFSVFFSAAQMVTLHMRITAFTHASSAVHVYGYSYIGRFYTRDG